MKIDKIPEVKKVLRDLKKGDRKIFTKREFFNSFMVHKKYRDDPSSLLTYLKILFEKTTKNTPLKSNGPRTDFPVYRMS